MAKKAVNKEVPPATAKKVAKKKEVQVELIEFSVRATIPTQAYGNIMPNIVVKAPTIEIARDAVMPVIVEMFETYMEEPRDGRKPSFVSKARVTVEERIVSTQEINESQGATSPDAYVAPSTVESQKSPAYTKAENAIKAAASPIALDTVEAQIKKSVKLTDQEKSLLYTVILQQRKEK